MTGGSKSPLSSKTINFNIVSGILIPAIWPFLPKSFRDQDYAIAAVTAWFSILNVVARLFTYEAVSFFKKDVTNATQEQDKPPFKVEN